jgi:hypothetical protein
MACLARWTLIAGIACVIAVLPVVWFRAVYAHDKRLRVIEPGRVYRSGQLTAAGFDEAVRRFGLRTIINLQDDYPDPDIYRSFLNRDTVKESDLCAQLGVRFVCICPDLISRREVGVGHPAAIDEFRAIMDDPASYPVLLHCKAGLHRTGCLAAVYRMEYQGWTPSEAYHELKAHGFGDWVCTAANDYVAQYVLSYRPRTPRAVGVARGAPAPGARPGPAGVP